MSEEDPKPENGDKPEEPAPPEEQELTEAQHAQARELNNRIEVLARALAPLLGASSLSICASYQLEDQVGVTCFGIASAGKTSAYHHAATLEKLAHNLSAQLLERIKANPGTEKVQ